MLTSKGLLWLATCAVLVVGMIGCSTSAPVVGGGGDTGENANNGDQTTDEQATNDDEPVVDDLTDSEKKAIVAASNAPGGLAQATDVAEDSTGDLPDDGSSDSAQIVPSEVSFGTCPEVSKSGSLISAMVDLINTSGALALSVDFGEEACTALAVEDPESGEEFTLVCSGSATGAFSFADQRIDLAFDNISCNDQALDGTAELTYELLSPGVVLDGAWDLVWYPGDDAIATKGDGIGSYEPVIDGCCDVTTIQEFTGNITCEGDEWSTTMEGILVSLEKYYSFIPYGGSITLDGPDIRPITITFNENSPTTGEVTISIGNGRSFTISLYELEEWAEMMLG